MTPKQKSLRTKSLAVLTQSRRTKKLPRVIAREHHISLITVIHHTNGFKKVNNRWIAKKYDHASRSMLISENGKLQSVQVSDSRHAKTIGRYHNAVKFYLNTGDYTKLKKLVLEINEKIEEIEFFEVYDS